MNTAVQPHTAVITGGAGFIGSNLADILTAKGWIVHIVDNFRSGRHEYVPATATLFEADIRDGGELDKAFAGAEYVFHLAAEPSVQFSLEHPEETNEINVTGTLNVLQAAVSAKVKRIVFASSCSIYGDQSTMPLSESAAPEPVSPYALHKWIGERYLKLWSRYYGLSGVSLRFFNVYGPRGKSEGAYAHVIARFVKLRSESKPLTVTGDGSTTRDYVHVRDVCDAIVRAAEAKTIGAGEAINIGSGVETSVSEIARLVGGGVVRIEPRFEPKRAVADIARARELLGWQPTVQLENGVRELLETAGIAPNQQPA